LLTCAKRSSRSPRIMKMTETNSTLGNAGQKRMLLLMLLLAMCSGCLTPRLNNTERLINHPQFRSAVIAAPDWTRDALETIADLEREIEAE